MCWLTVYSPLHTAGCSSLMCWLTVNSKCPFHALNDPFAAATHTPIETHTQCNEHINAQWQPSVATN